MPNVCLGSDAVGSRREDTVDKQNDGSGRSVRTRFLSRTDSTLPNSEKSLFSSYVNGSKPGKVVASELVDRYFLSAIAGHIADEDRLRVGNSCRVMVVGFSTVKSR